MFDSQYYPHPSRRNLVYAKKGMVASSHPLATQAGLRILQDGGNAVDAALAIAAALTVVDPANNGIGGDCFAIVSMKGQNLYGLNSSGYAPALFDAEKVRALGHTQMPLRGALSVTVPGAVAGWVQLHERFATRPMETLFAPAIALAQGYALSPDNAPVLNAMTRVLDTLDDNSVRHWRGEFNPAGETFRAGQVYALPNLGQSLHAIAQSRGRAFYEGAIAEKIDAYARENGLFLRGDDLARYRAREVEPVSTDYQGAQIWELPPNGQGMTALVALNIIEQLPIAGHLDVDTLHLQMEAIKLAFADSLHYIADPDYMRVSVESLLSKTYAVQRAAQVGDRAQIFAPGQPMRGDTVYFCCADGQGNSISMIQSLYQGFGSGVTIPGTGIALQDRGACFSLEKGHPNEAAAGKYPYHTIIPGFITRDGAPLGPFGIMGGYMQPQAHMQVVMNLLRWNLNPQAALDAPRFCWTQGLEFDMEGSFAPQTIDALRRRGHDIRVVQGGQYGRGQIILCTQDGTLVGATEPRADGCVIGC